MLRKSNVVETWFSKEEESVSHNNNNNGLINRILKLENELNKALNENTILKEQIRKYENTELQRLNKKRVIYFNIYLFS
jgi:hypothetical protein